jgi:hypothetical protein
MTKLYQLQEKEREARAAQSIANSAATAGRPSHSWLSLERFRNAPKFHLRPAAADLAFCVAALSLRMPDDAIASSVRENGKKRKIVIESRPEFAIVKLTGSRERFPLSWETIYQIAKQHHANNLRLEAEAEKARTARNMKATK